MTPRQRAPIACCQLTATLAFEALLPLALGFRQDAPRDKFLNTPLTADTHSTYLTTRLINHSVQQTMATDQLSVTFAALADPTRRAILGRLASGNAPSPSWRSPSK